MQVLLCKYLLMKKGVAADRSKDSALDQEENML